MFDRVLVPVDGSNVSALAVEAAVELCRRFDAGLHAVHVVDTNELPLGAEASMLDDLVSRAEDLVAQAETTAAWRRCVSRSTFPVLGIASQESSGPGRSSSNR